jgi:hypothetical protein
MSLRMRKNTGVTSLGREVRLLAVLTVSYRYVQRVVRFVISLGDQALDTVIR